MAKIKDKFLETAPGGGSDVTVFKSSDQTTQSSSYVDDSDIEVNYDANGIYKIELLVLGACRGNNVNLLIVQLTTSNNCSMSYKTARGLFYDNPILYDNVGETTNTTNHAISMGANGNCVSLSHGIFFAGTSDGSMKLQFYSAPNNKNVTIKKGTYLTMQKL